MNCPWKPPLRVKTISIREVEVMSGGNEIYLRGQACQRIIDAEHRIIFECESMIDADEIVKILNKKFPKVKS